MAVGALLGLGSALAFGVCDFVAGLSARRMSFWWVTLLSLVASVAGAWLCVLVQGDDPSRASVAWGVLAGVGAAVGSTALYRGYGRGQMAVAGPLSAVGTASLPALVGAALGDRLPATGLAGVLLALPAIWLMAGGGPVGARARTGVVDGLVSGAGFALEFIGLERAGDASGLWPVAVSQSTALVLLAVVVRAVRPRAGGGVTAVLLAVLAGGLSLLATVLYFLAAHAGLLTVAAVLAALYPGVTVALAAIVLRERPDRRQVGGLLLGAAAVTLIVAA
ncbi:MAG: DMT family transporter [Nocardioidaceae bacterium]|nr:DMT family transporter [Nocardioidaceae bacterium]